MQPILCLGTVQFGLNYGVTNKKGKVPANEVLNIFNLAAKRGISLVDTAQDYGNSEEIVGKYWPLDIPIRLISKLHPNAHPKSWEESFQSSLKRLNAHKLDSFLIHRASDLIGEKSFPLLEWLKSLKERKLVDRIGVSIYDEKDLEGLPLDLLDLIQLPLSIYDQRLLKNGTIDYLYDLGIAIHARSIFLQGLILKPETEWPIFLTDSFKTHHRKLADQQKNMSSNLLNVALAFVKYCPKIEAILFGVLSCHELNQLLDAWLICSRTNLISSTDWAWENEQDIDPRCWLAFQ